MPRYQLCNVYHKNGQYEDLKDIVISYYYNLYTL